VLFRGCLHCSLGCAAKLLSEMKKQCGRVTLALGVYLLLGDDKIFDDKRDKIKNYYHLVKIPPSRKFFIWRSFVSERAFLGCFTNSSWFEEARVKSRREA
jgi:hypothetical protein